MFEINLSNKVVVVTGASRGIGDYCKMLRGERNESGLRRT